MAPNFLTTFKFCDLILENTIIFSYAKLFPLYSLHKSLFKHCISKGSSTNFIISRSQDSTMFLLCYLFECLKFELKYFLIGLILGWNPEHQLILVCSSSVSVKWRHLWMFKIFCPSPRPKRGRNKANIV